MTEQQRPTGDPIRSTQPVANGTIPLQTPDRGRPTEQVFPRGEEGPLLPRSGFEPGQEAKGPRRDLRVLTRDLINDLQLMLKQEGMLLRREIQEKISALKTGSALLTSAMVVGFVGFQALVATVIIALAEVMPWWLSAFLVAAILLIAGGVMAKMGKSRIEAENLKPQKSADTLQAMGDMLQERVSEFKQSS